MNPPSVQIAIDPSIPYVPLMRALVEAAQAVGCTLEQDRRGGLRIVRSSAPAQGLPTSGTRIVGGRP